MKNKYIKIILIFAMIFTLTGCTKILKDENKKPVQNVATGQSLPANILCQPEDEKVIEIYKKNNIDIKKLPRCENFKITSGGYEGIWDTIFVKPLAFVIIQLAKLFKNYGVSIIVITLLIRLAMYPVTKKTAMQSENLKSAKPELDRLEKKYQNKTDNDSKMMKSQEMLAIYKKFGINPMSGCLYSFIQIPLFFAFFEGLNRLPAVFEGQFLGLQMGTSPITGISNGNILYAIVIILVIGATYFSMKLNGGAGMGAEQEKQMKMMTNVMVVMISIASFTISTGIALYWIANNSFTIIQNLIVKKEKKV